MRKLLCLAAVAGLLATNGDAAPLHHLAGRNPKAHGRDGRAVRRQEPRALARARSAAAGTAPKPLWTFNTGSSLIYAHPAISNGAFYVAAGSLYVLSAADGTKQLTFDAPDGGKIYSTPLVVGGDVVVGTTEGTLYAIDRQSRQVRWSASLGGRDMRGYPVASADGKMVYTSAGSMLFAIDAATGAVAWTQALASAGNYRHPLLVGGLVLMAAGDVRAFDRVSGAPAWNTTSIPNANNAVRCGGASSVFISGKPQSALVDGTTGQVAWTAGYTVQYPQCDPSTGVIIAPSAGSNLNALDMASGSALWTVATSGTLVATPGIAAGVAYVGTTAGQELAVDVKTGARVWSFAVQGGDAVWAGSAVSNGVLYFAANNGYAYALPVAAREHATVLRCTDGECGDNCRQVAQPIGSCTKLAGEARSVVWTGSNTTAAATVTVYQDSISCSGAITARYVLNLNTCYGDPFGGSFKILGL